MYWDPRNTEDAGHRWLRETDPRATPDGSEAGIDRIDTCHHNEPLSRTATDELTSWQLFSMGGVRMKWCTPPRRGRRVHIQGLVVDGQIHVLPGGPTADRPARAPGGLDAAADRARREPAEVVALDSGRLLAPISAPTVHSRLHGVRGATWRPPPPRSASR